MLIIALLSLSLIALEIAWTRLFSAEFFFTFAFLILSLAVLGLGLGALAVRLLPGGSRRDRLPLYLTLTALMTLAGPPLVFLLDPHLSQMFHSPLEIGKLVATLLLLSSAYFFGGGMGLALLFRHGHERLDRLYMADLLGAGVGVLYILPLMNMLGTPAASFYCALPVLFAAFQAAPLEAGAGGAGGGHGAAQSAGGSSAGEGA